MKDLEYYIKQFTRLRRATGLGGHWTEATRNRAPHKPILLLAVIDLFSRGIVPTNFLQITPELMELFGLYWARVMPVGRKGQIQMPFFHLQSDGFWHLVPLPGQEDTLQGRIRAKRIGSLLELQRLVAGVSLDEELFLLLNREDARIRLRAALLESCFSSEAWALLVEQAGENADSYRYSLDVLRISREGAVRETGGGEWQYRRTRDQGFRLAVVKTYEHRCALCGIRMLTPDGHTVVDAGHIKPWSVCGDDRVQNGLALCKLCHWSFDEGLVGVGDDYRILTSPLITTGANVPGAILTLAGRPIIGPGEKTFWPDLDCLSWHREEWGLR